jgi:hypothetical protein
LDKKGWRTIAIIFIILFILENLLIAYGLYLINKEEKMIKECYYDICEEYPDASLNGDICTCYDYDLFGNLVNSKQRYLR